MNKKRFLIPLLILMSILSLLTQACGTNESPETNVSSPQGETALPNAVPTLNESSEEEASSSQGEVVSPNAATTLKDVQQATIQIEYLGAYKDPAIGAVSGSGYGSGFIIDPSGIAVTNNHVVAGAASLKVRIGGDKDKTYNAKILGVSECSDLAVIDIEGENFPYLGWYEGDITVGMDVYAVGFPLGETEFTMTRGVVSKASAPGETAWASVDAVIGHDATINPGNSGGPLVTTDGQVVGVNYSSRPDYNQYFAISTEKAIPLTKKLSTGENVDFIGVNGQAVVAKDGSLSGVWVSSVVSGSPADKAGLQGGDVITNMEGVPLAQDGTLSEYCDILRSHDATDALSVNVLRFDTQEGLEGQINGDPLSVAFSFGKEAEQASNGQMTSGSLVKFKDSLASGGAEGADKFSFIGTPGGELTVFVTPSTNLDVALVVLDSDNKPVASVNKAGAGEAERLVYTVPSNAKTIVYSIFVMGETGGDYEGIFIGSQQVFFKLMPQFLIAGSPPSGESVGYAYAGEAKKTLTVITTSDPKHPIDVKIRVFALSDMKTVLAEANNTEQGKAELLAFPIPKDGVYIILVSDAQGGAGSFLMATTTK